MSAMKPRRKSLWHRFCLQIAGPAQIGDPSLPIRPSASNTDMCPRCGEPMSTHEAVHAKGNTLLKCRSTDAVEGG